MTYPNPKASPNPDVHDRGGFMSDTPIFHGMGLVIPAGADVDAAYEPLVFDGPARVVPDRIKEAAGLQPDDKLSMLDLSGVLMLVVVTDDEQAHIGGPATTPEQIVLLHQVLAGLVALP